MTRERAVFAAEQFVVSTQLEVSFDFRTVQQNGIILTTSNTYSGIAIQMYEGKVRCQLSSHLGSDCSVFDVCRVQQQKFSFNLLNLEYWL